MVEVRGEFTLDRHNRPKLLHNDLTRARTGDPSLGGKAHCMYMRFKGGYETRVFVRLGAKGPPRSCLCAERPRGHSRVLCDRQSLDQQKNSKSPPGKKWGKLSRNLVFAASPWAFHQDACQHGQD